MMEVKWYTTSMKIPKIGEMLLAACAYDKLQAINKRLNKLTVIRGEERRPACIMDAVGTNKGNACAKMPSEKNCGECIQRWLNSEAMRLWAECGGL